jgi:hypothetical protein
VIVFSADRVAPMMTIDSPSAIRIGQQVMRELGDGEHVDQVEEQLDVRDPLRPGPVPQERAAHYQA